MEFENFISTLTDPSPPATVSAYLHAMWFDARGDWAKAHDIVQYIDDGKAALIHAYLHRKEGDTANARYWYNRAGEPFPTVSLQQEWEQIVKDLLHTAK